MISKLTIAGLFILILSALLMFQAQAALYRAAPPCGTPVITEWKPLYPSIAALATNTPDSYQPIYRCVEGR